MRKSPKQLTTALERVVIVGASLAGCTSSSSHGASASLSASKANSFSASKLRAALLTRVNGVGAASPAASGDYTAISAQVETFSYPQNYCDLDPVVKDDLGRPVLRITFALLPVLAERRKQVAQQ